MLSAARHEVLAARSEPGADPEIVDRVLRQLDMRSLRQLTAVTGRAGRAGAAGVSGSMVGSPARAPAAAPRGRWSHGAAG